MIGPRVTPGFALLMGAVLAVSCTTEPSRRFDKGGPLHLDPTSWPAGLSLVVVTVDDTVREGDRVQIGYAIRNRGSAMRFRNDPLDFGLEVSGPRGEIRPQQQLEFPSLGDLPDLYLPDGSMLVNIIDITCINGQYFLKSRSDCIASFPLGLGEFRVIITYRGTVVSDSVDTRAQATGPRLVDTTTVVIVPE